ncbi:MAG: hypothetical protein IIT86_07980, partial [Oscillospiraceae bacterium]|nr:hypothetical protein [Oscillospiraceae bacterium]
SRTPMQWGRGVNAGFSSASPESLYLPLDPDPDRPTVEAQEADPDSLFSYIQKLIVFRKQHTALRGDSGFEFLSDGTDGPLAYIRKSCDESLLIAINPSETPVVFTVPQEALPADILLSYGDVLLTGMSLKMQAGSYCVLSL